VYLLNRLQRLNQDQTFTFLSVLGCVLTGGAVGGDVGDVGVVVEARRVVVDVGHRHGHGGRAGQAPRPPSVCRHHQQLVIVPVLSVQQRAGDDLPRGRVDGELSVSSRQTVAVGTQRNTFLVESFRGI